MKKINDGAAMFGATPLLIGSQLAISASAIFAKFALVGAGAVMVAALRLTIATAVVAFISNQLRVKQKIPRSHEGVFGFCGLALAVYWTTWIAALKLTNVATATLLVATAPIWTTLYDIVFLRRRPSIQFWIGFLSTVVGTVIAAQAAPVRNQINTESEHILGILLSVAGGFAFACYLIAVRGMTDTYPTLIITNRTYSWSACGLWLCALLFREQFPQNNPTAWAGIFGMALVPQLLGYAGINASLKKFSPNVVALSTLLEPVFASVLAYFIFHEALTGAMLIGALLIVAGLIAVMTVKMVET